MDKLDCTEDVKEASYRIDWMITQLRSVNCLKRRPVSSLGVCTGCNDYINSKSLSLKEVIFDYIKP